MNFTRTVTIELEVYQSMEKRLVEAERKYMSIERAIETWQYANSINAKLMFIQPTSELELKLSELVKVYESKITELEADNKRLMREVESLQVQHRNDQGLD